MRAIPLLLIIALCAGCAGADFKRPDSESLHLGQTSEKEIRARYGDPRGEKTLVMNDQTIKVLTYAHAEAAPYVEKIPVRAMTYSFHEGTLVGFDYTSSFSSDKTDFDDTLVNQIVQGQTTRDRVVALLGQPTGIVIRPLVKAPGQQAYFYSYSRTDKNPWTGQLRRRTKSLVITFDGTGVVTEKILSTGGTK
jgi:outer membrane protein assembly factor BamE (lipoprotein component of BamABCDE complex)